MTEFFNQYFYEKDNKYSVIIEDNGLVSYAYLLFNDEVIGDVWINNKTNDSSKQVDFTDVSQMPFMNPIENISNIYMNISINYNNIGLHWRLSSNKIKVLIFLESEIIVALEDGAKPGWSNIVINNSPVANKLNNEKINQIVGQI
jgi:hypothetical protein